MDLISVLRYLSLLHHLRARTNVNFIYNPLVKLSAIIQSSIFRRKTFQVNFARRSKTRARTIIDSEIKKTKLAFDKEGKLLLISHESAGLYYKINFGFLLGWFLISLKNYKENDSFIFSNKTMTKMYMSSIGFAILLTFLMSNRHLRQLYLHSNGKDATVVHHKFFSLWYSENVVDIKSFNGVKSIMSSGMHLYQLDYSVKGWFKNRETFMIFRPQYVHDLDVWKLVRTGNYIRTPEYIANNKDRFL